eukprot:scaffold35161_cov64-Phaeocystis_antarctica.AAC.15
MIAKLDTRRASRQPAAHLSPPTSLLVGLHLELEAAQLALHLVELRLHPPAGELALLSRLPLALDDLQAQRLQLALGGELVWVDAARRAGRARADEDLEPVHLLVRQLVGHLEPCDLAAHHLHHLLRLLLSSLQRLELSGLDPAAALALALAAAATAAEGQPAAAADIRHLHRSRLAGRRARHHRTRPAVRAIGRRGRRGRHRVHPQPAGGVELEERGRGLRTVPAAEEEQACARAARDGVPPPFGQPARLAVHDHLPHVGRGVDHEDVVVERLARRASEDEDLVGDECRRVVRVGRQPGADVGPPPRHRLAVEDEHVAQLVRVERVVGRVAHAADDEEEAVDHRAAVAGARRRRRASCCRLRPRPVLGVQRVQVAQAARPLVAAEDDQVIAVQAGGVEVARLRLPAAGGRLVPLVVHRVEDAHVVEPAARIGTPEDHQVRRHPQRRARVARPGRRRDPAMHNLPPHGVIDVVRVQVVEHP